MPSRTASWTVSSEPVGRLPAGVVELLDDVDRGQVGAAELGEPAPEREAGPDPADEAGIGQGDADVGDRRLREAEPARQLARPEGDRRVLRQDVEDGRGAGHGRRQRLRLGPFERARSPRTPPSTSHAPIAHSRPATRPDAVSMVNCVQHIDSRLSAGILFSLPPAVQYAGRRWRRSRGGGCCVAIQIGRGCDRAWSS